MSSGKFSQPRPHRDEERQIEEAFRQVTGQAPKAPPPGHSPKINPIPQETQVVPDIPLEELLKDHAPNPEPVPSAPSKEKNTFDLISEEVERFFDADAPDLTQEPEEDLPEPDLIDKLMAFWDNRTGFSDGQQKTILVGICAIALVLIIGFIAVLFSSAQDPYDKKILRGVTVAGVDLGGMTQKQATNAVKDLAAQTWGSQDMRIDLSGQELRLTAKNVKAKLDVKAVVKKAYDHGRAGTNAENALAYEQSLREAYVIDLAPYLSLDKTYIKTALEDYAQEAGSTLTQPTYGLEGQEPELSAEKFNENAPTQTLVITLGTPGIGFDPEAVYDQVLEAYQVPQFLVTVETVEGTQEPEEVDLEAIYQEFHIAPVEASYDPRTQKAIPGAYGYGFDLEAAEKLLENAEFGDEIRIPMEYIPPEMLDADAFFRDTLGQYQTRHSSNGDRNTNLRLASEAIDGTLLSPGDSFSFNAVVGNRSAARGYKKAFADDHPYASEYVGGGVTQVASTLYYAAMLSDLEIQSRTPGKYAPGFIDLGMDVEVGSSTDFRFRNNTTYPIRIDAKVSGGYVKISIVGTETRSHSVLMEQSIANTLYPSLEYKEFEEGNKEGHRDGDELEEGITGYSVKLYKVKYDSETNRQLSRDYVATVDYRSENRVLVQIKPEETTVPTTETTVPPTTIPPTTTPSTVPTTTPTAPPTTSPPSETTLPPVTDPSTTPSSDAASQESPAVDPDSSGNSQENLIPAA